MFIHPEVAVLDRRRDRKKGYALVSIIVIGVFAVMLLLALATTLISVMQSESVAKQKSGLLSAAETGLDYVLKDIKRAIDAGETTYDLTDDNPSVLVSVPSNWIDDSKITVNARVRKLDSFDRAQEKSFGLLWSPQLDPVESVGTDFSDPVRGTINSTQNASIHKKIIEVTASKGVFSTSIRVVTEPVLNESAPPSANFPGAGILSLSRLRIDPSGGSLTVDSYPATSFDDLTDSNGNPYKSFSLQLRSNRTLRLDGQGNNLNINANVIASNNPNGAPGEFADLSGDVEINGRFETNGGNQSDFTGTDGPQNNPANDNVNALADQLAANDPSVDRAGLNQDPIDTNASNDPIGANPTPTTTTQSVTTQGGDVTTNDLSSFLNTLGDYSDPGSTITLTHGVDSSGNEVSSYKTSSLFANDNVAKVVLDPANTQPTKIFIDGTNAEAPVEIDTSRFINNGSPENLQIYYDGPGDVTIRMNGGDFNGLVYAPNANVTVRNGNNSSSSQAFSGAIVANRTNIRMQGKMQLVPDLNGVGSGKPAGTNTIQSFKVSTYQEVTGKLVQ